MNAAGQENLTDWHALPLEERRVRIAERRKLREHLYNEHVFNGITLQELADKHNTNKTFVTLQIAKHADKLAKKRDYNIPAERMQQYHQLKTLMEGCFTRGIKGDDFAIRSYVSLAARFAKVIGLDAPTRFQHEVNKKSTVVHEHTVDLDDLQSRIDILRARQKQLAANQAIAAPISAKETDEVVPVSNENYKKEPPEVAISAPRGSQSDIDADYSVVVAGHFTAEEVAQNMKQELRNSKSGIPDPSTP